LRSRRIVRGTNCVAAELFQLPDTECLQRVRDRRANAGVILMIACAVNLVSLAVQQKTALRIKTERANPESRLLLIDDFVSNTNGRHQRVQARRLRGPQNRRSHLRLKLDRRRRLAGHFDWSLESREGFAFRGNNLAVDLCCRWIE